MACRFVARPRRARFSTPQRGPSGPSAGPIIAAVAAPMTYAFEAPCEDLVAGSCAVIGDDDTGLVTAQITFDDSKHRVHLLRQSRVQLPAVGRSLGRQRERQLLPRDHRGLDPPAPNHELLGRLDRLRKLERGTGAGDRAPHRAGARRAVPVSLPAGMTPASPEESAPCAS